jgi:hypothetical protein
VFGSDAGDDPGVFAADPGTAEGEFLSADHTDLSSIWKIDSVSVGDPCGPTVDATMSAFLDNMIRGALHKW